MILWLQVGAWPLKYCLSFLSFPATCASPLKFYEVHSLRDLTPSLFCTLLHPWNMQVIKEGWVCIPCTWLSSFFRPFTILVWPLVRSTRNRLKSYTLGSSAIFILDIKPAWAVIQEIFASSSGWCSLWSCSAEGSELDTVLMKWLCCIGKLPPLRLTLQGTEKKKRERGLLLVKCRIRHDWAKEEREQVGSFIFPAASLFLLENPSNITYFLPKISWGLY